MSEQFERIRAMYKDGFRQHGDSPHALLTPKGRNDLRFRAISSFVLRPGVRVLDYGCGLGYLWDFLQRQDNKVDYTGIDMLPEFIEACRAKHGAQARFELMDVRTPIREKYDVVFASGVFNLRSDTDDARSREYALHRLEELFNAAGEVLVCDFLSSHVDYVQADGQHFNPGVIADFCATRLSRRFMIRHDLLPYEFTLIVWRDGSIRRPDNIYEVDASTTS